MRYVGPFAVFGWSRVPGLLTNDGKTNYAINPPPPPPAPGAPAPIVGAPLPPPITAPPLPPTRMPTRRAPIGFFTGLKLRQNRF